MRVMVCLMFRSFYGVLNTLHAWASGAGGPWPSWIFSTGKVEGRLMVLLFGLVFSVAFPKNFLPTPLPP